MRNAAGRRAAFVLCLGLASFGCGRDEKSGADARHYEVRGIVRGFSPGRQTIEIEHEDVPGFMPSMTMPFIVRDAEARAALRPGDAISFRLHVTEQDSWIDQIQKIDAGSVRLPSPKPETPRSSATRLREGDALPGFELVDQDGKKITNETFRGHPLVLTFIFTRCPIPNYCPLMSKNFAELQRAIKEGPAPLNQTQLLSISFDPDFDSAQVLKDYAAGEGADTSYWRFATGGQSEIEKLTRGFSVLVQPEGGTISHSLATALIDKEGRIKKIWRGNGWKPGEAVQQISAPAE